MHQDLVESLGSGGSVCGRGICREAAAGLEARQERVELRSDRNGS